MSGTRASIFEDDDLDLDGFVPKAGIDESAPPAEAVREVAEAANFRRREVAIEEKPVVQTKREPRRYRTGRNVQFNVKVSQQTADAFYAISDRFGWVLGETLEQALKALEAQVAGKTAKD